MANFPPLQTAEDIFFEGSDTPWYRQPGQGQDPVRAMAGRIIRADYYQSLLTGSPIGTLAESKSRLMLGKLSGLDESLAYTQMSFGVQTQNRDQKFRLLIDALNADALHASSPTRHHKWTNPFSSSPEEIRSGDTLSFPSEKALVAYLEKHPLTRDHYLKENGIIARVAESFAFEPSDHNHVMQKLVEMLPQEDLSNHYRMSFVMLFDAALKDCARNQEQGSQQQQSCKDVDSLTESFSKLTVTEKAAIILKDAAKKPGVSDFIKEVQRSFVLTREQVMVYSSKDFDLAQYHANCLEQQVDSDAMRLKFQQLRFDASQSRAPADGALLAGLSPQQKLVKAKGKIQTIESTIKDAERFVNNHRKGLKVAQQLHFDVDAVGKELKVASDNLSTLKIKLVKATKKAAKLEKALKAAGRFAGPIGALLLAADVGSAMIGSANAPDVGQRPQ